MNKNKKAPARARTKVEYLLTTKLFCGQCKEMMTGFSGTGKMGKVYRYYECKGAKNKLCRKKKISLFKNKNGPPKAPHRYWTDLVSMRFKKYFSKNTAYQRIGYSLRANMGFTVVQ